MIGSIRQECLDHVVVFGERHLRQMLLSYMHYYKRTDTFISEQRCAATAGCSSRRAHSPDTNFRRITPSLCSDLISDKDRSQGRAYSQSKGVRSHRSAVRSGYHTDMPTSENAGTETRQRGLTMNILEKIAIFGLLTIASISVAVVVLPRLPMDTQIFSVPADTEPFLGQ